MINDRNTPDETDTSALFRPQPDSHQSISNQTMRMFRMVSSFFLSQGALQGVGVLANLYLVRALSVESYAQFGLSYGFQATMAALMDLGFASTIVPLVGERFENSHLVGRYVRAAKHLRDRAFWILSPLVAIGFMCLMSKHHWPFRIQMALLVSVLLSLYSSGKVSYFSAPLFLYRRLRGYYFAQTMSGITRVLIYVVLGVCGFLNASVAALLSALNVTLNGWLIGRQSRKYLTWPDKNDATVEAEVLKYILPATPAIILGAFHGQIALFLVSVFGGTTSIAQVAALTRMGQLFAFLMTFNVIIVEPYVARLHSSRLLSTYAKFIAAAILASSLLSIFSFLVPDPFLWLLGPKYIELRGLMGWVVVTACLNYVAGLMWIMNRSRKWVFWRGTILEVLLVLVVQIGYLVIVGITTTRQAVFFNFASSFCYLITHGYIAIYGYTKRQHLTETDLAADL